MIYSKDQMCFELLRALYVHAREHPGEPFSEAALEDEFNVSPVQFDLVVDWLVEAGYARVSPPNGQLALTDHGQAEMDHRTTGWREGVERLTGWLDEEKARIADRKLPQSQEITLKKAAVFELRRRRQDLETRLRDLHTPFELSI